LVDPDDPKKLADTIQYVLSHLDEAHAKGRTARERCKQRYDMSNLRSGLHELVEHVSAKKG